MRAKIGPRFEQWSGEVNEVLICQFHRCEFLDAAQSLVLIDRLDAGFANPGQLPATLARLVIACVVTVVCQPLSQIGGGMPRRKQPRSVAD
ncbi:hypothetical protein D3P04_21990 [Paracoccus onubensis]|uniref:Uncharacterized protein n=1 Tax=Paracoccus onubensis TaxID=1675788 RepID=A0A418SM43_9RHOB|nr:hypothetical protein D3P04_21990 [Paracoccus onubensis]